MYHVAGTGITAIIIYILSYFFYRNGYFSKQFHRKLWNIILAVTFLFTALAGVFMALQINYKWNVPIIKTILKWHVEVGAGMAITGIFHFLWHYSYFTRIFKASDNIVVNNNYQKITENDIRSNLFLTGFTSTSVQLLLIREIMNISGGYELITGTFLGSWLIGSAIGASLAGRSPMNDIKRTSLIFSITPFISLVLLIVLSRLFFKPGETPSFLAGMILTFLVLIPFCLASGFAFVKLISAAWETNDFVPGKSFSIETSGGVVAGIVISVVTSGLLNTYQILLIIIILYLTYVALTFYFKNKIRKTIVKILVATMVSGIIICNPDVFFRQALLPGIKVTGSKDTPYGNITKGEYAGEKSLYYNQRLLSYHDDVTEREEDIHYAMLQRANPEKVLLISGSLSSHLPEILKYPVKKIVYVERDPALIEEENNYLREKRFDNLFIANDDALRFVKNSEEIFDVVIVLIPPPSTLLLNRYYTTEFFAEVKKRLKSNGVFMCSPGQGNDYFNKESVNLFSSIFNSMTGTFKNVRPVNGNKLYFIASDSDISVSFCHLAEERKIETVYVSSDFLDDGFIEKKSKEVLLLMDPEIKQNRSAFPIACFHFQSYSFSKDIDEKMPAIILLILVFAVPGLTIKRKNLLMYFSASSLAGFEIIVLLTLQLTVGSLYQLTGLIMAGLMTGLAVGSGTNFRLLNKFSLGSQAVFLMAFYIIMGFVFDFIPLIKNEKTGVILIILTTIFPALLTGNIFRQLTLSKNGETTPSETYSADLAGSALGFILMSGLAVPALGIKVSIFLLSLFIFAGFLFGTVKNKQ